MPFRAAEGLLKRAFGAAARCLTIRLAFFRENDGSLRIGDRGTLDSPGKVDRLGAEKLEWCRPPNAKQRANPNTRGLRVIQTTAKVANPSGNQRNN